MTAEADLSQPDRQAALAVLLAFRALFLEPLRQVEKTTQQIVDQVSPGAPVTGRPKRSEAIIVKLWRQSILRLSQMEDIGGCRAVLPGLVEVRRAQELVLQRYPAAHMDDYIARPKPTGCRAIHLVVIEAGRRVEVQLRTHRQNEWADAVESAAGRLHQPLKDGRGPNDLLQYFEWLRVGSPSRTKEQH